MIDDIQALPGLCIVRTCRVTINAALHKRYYVVSRLPACLQGQNASPKQAGMELWLDCSILASTRSVAVDQRPEASVAPMNLTGRNCVAKSSMSTLLT
jgi:hypothetical protein